MITVDLAFNSILKRISNDASATWFTLRPPETTSLRGYIRNDNLNFKFQSLEENLEELYDYDALVVWGDFLQARHYMEQDATNYLLKYGQVKTRGAAMDLLLRTLLLSEASDDVLDRTILYGGTIIHNSQSDYSDQNYTSAYSRLVSKSRAVWMREPLSAAKVSQSRLYDGKANFGADAALLLDPDDLNLNISGWADSISSERDIGVFVGVRTSPPAWLPRFCLDLANYFGGRLVWIPWLEGRQPTWLDVDNTRGEHTFGDLLSALYRCRLVITDTYHLCLNAWRSGTPAICVGEPQPTNSSQQILTLNDLKKYVFYLSYDASELYIPTNISEEQLQDRLVNLIHTVEHDGTYIVDRIRRHADHSANVLRNEIVSVLSTSLSDGARK